MDQTLSNEEDNSPRTNAHDFGNNSSLPNIRELYDMTNIINLDIETVLSSELPTGRDGESRPCPQALLLHARTNADIYKIH